MYNVCITVMLYVYYILFVLLYCYMYNLYFCITVLKYVYDLQFVLLYCSTFSVKCLKYCNSICILYNLFISVLHKVTLYAVYY